jgi:hypothetical protein
MSLINLILFLLFGLHIVSAEITVLTPNGTTNAVVNEPLLITWKSSGDDVPQTITIKLSPKNPTNEYTVGQSISTSNEKFTWNNITSDLVGDNNWKLNFYDAVSNLNEKSHPIANSDVFSIKPAGFKSKSDSPKTDSPKTENDSNNITAFSSYYLLASLISLLIYF